MLQTRLPETVRHKIPSCMTHKVFSIVSIRTLFHRVALICDVHVLHFIGVCIDTYVIYQGFFQKFMS